MKARIVKRGGLSYFDIDGELYAPDMFRSFRPRPDNVSLFARNGVKLFQFLISGRDCGMQIPYSLYPPVWLDYGKYDFKAFDCQMEMFLRWAPDGLFCPFIQLDTPAARVTDNPEDIDSFYKLDTAMFDEEWKREASDYANALIAYAEEKYGDRIFAYAFTAGRSCEWFMRDWQVNSSPDKLAAYRKYTGNPEAELPDAALFKEKSDSLYRSPSSPEMTYATFMADTSADLVCYFSAELQKTLKHRKPIGTFYGYTIFSDCGQTFNCHNSHRRVFECADLDMIFSPAAYGDFRREHNTCGWQLEVDSLAHCGKLYVHEIDHRTPLAYYPLEKPTNDRHIYLGIGYRHIGDCLHSMEETVRVLRREVAASICRGTALWWFDFFGGYYGHPVLENEIRLCSDIFEMLKTRESRCENTSIAEIAFFTDSDSFAVTREAYGIHRDLVTKNLMSLGLCGAPFDMLSVDDLPTLDCSRYKLAVFPYSFAPKAETLAFIADKLGSALKVWLMAPGWEPDESTDAVEAVCGIKTEIIPDSEGGAAELFGTDCALSGPITPVLAICDPDARVIGRYKNSGKPAAAVKGDNLLCEVPPLSWQAWHEIAGIAGVNIMTEGGSSLFCSSCFFTFQSPRDGGFTINLPRSGRAIELFSGRTYEVKDNTLTVDAIKYDTLLFMWED